MIIDESELNDIKLLLGVGHLYVNAFGPNDRLSMTDLLMLNEVESAIARLEQLTK
jgi:hypothetical protein